MGYNYWNGTEAAHRRVMMKAAGYSDEDIRQKPAGLVGNNSLKNTMTRFSCLHLLL